MTPRARGHRRSSSRHNLGDLMMTRWLPTLPRRDPRPRRVRRDDGRQVPRRGAILAPRHRPGPPHDHTGRRQLYLRCI
jgi:hypothetical protein